MFLFFCILYFVNVFFSNRTDLFNRINSLECKRNEEIKALNDFIDIIRRNQHLDNFFTTNCIEIKRSKIQSLNNTIYKLRLDLETLSNSCDIKK